jgi:hypothetical protein
MTRDEKASAQAEEGDGEVRRLRSITKGEEMDD